MNRLVTDSAPVARQLSVQAVVDAVLSHGAITRTQLADITGLSKQTMSEVVRELERDGWLRVSGQAQGTVGRRAVIYEFEESSAYAVGVDLGGSNLRAAIATLNGRIIIEENQETDRRGGLHVIEQVAALVNSLASQAHIPAGRMQSGVVAVSGVFQRSTGAVKAASNIPGISDIDFGGLLQQRLQVPLAIENGVDMATKGEQWRGRARGSRNFVFVAHGAGIGMGAMIDGHLLKGRQGAIGEIAFLPIGANPFDPKGFSAGTLESEVGAAAMVRKFEGYGGFSGASVRDIFQALDKGYEPALAVVEETARLVALAIAAILAICDPEMVVMGGHIGMHPEMIRRVRQVLPRCTPLQTVIEASDLGPRAQVEGALCTAIQHLYDRVFGVAAVPAIKAPDGHLAAK